MSRNSLITTANTTNAEGHRRDCACAECNLLRSRAARAKRDLELLDAGTPKLAVQSRKPVVVDGKKMSERTTVRSSSRQRRKILERFGNKVVGKCACGEDLRLVKTGALLDSHDVEHLPAGLAHTSILFDPVFKRALQLAPESTLPFNITKS